MEYNLGCVNALKGATFISTRCRERRDRTHDRCVNALKGATFISTQERRNMRVADEKVSMP